MASKDNLPPQKKLPSHVSEPKMKMYVYRATDEISQVFFFHVIIIASGECRENDQNSYLVLLLVNDLVPTRSQVIYLKPKRQ